MAEFPHLPLFTDAYLADTRHLTTEEHGAYLLLMMEAWRRPECCLPDDDRLLARLCGLSIERWAEVKNTILAFWDRDGRRKVWSQKRLSKERLYVASKSASQRDKAVKRWKGEQKADAAALPSVCQEDAPTPTPTPTPSSLRSEEPQTPDLGLIGGEVRAAEKDRFDEFWAVFPRKLKKPDAIKAWKKVTKKNLPEKIIAAAKLYASMRLGEDEKYTQYPASWLNAERFNDPDHQPAPAASVTRWYAGGLVR